MSARPGYLQEVERVSLTLDGTTSAYEAVILQGDTLQSADRRMTRLDYLLWLEDDRGARLRPGVRISGGPTRPPLLKVFPFHWKDWRNLPSALVSVVDSELHFESGPRPELWQHGRGLLARMVFNGSRTYWETDSGEGQLVIASPVVFGDAMHAEGQRLRTSALAAA